MSTHNHYSYDWIDGDVEFPVPGDFKSERPGVTYGKMEDRLFWSSTVGKERTVRILLPAGYTETEKYPVLYLFHGFARDHRHWTEVDRGDLVIGNLIAAGEARPMIVVMPNCRARMNDEAAPTDEWTIGHAEAFIRFLNEELPNDLIPFIEENYSVAIGRENTAVAGFSMGGRTALCAGLKMPEKFGFIGAFCPAPGVLAYENLNNMSESGIFKESELRLPDTYKDNTYLVIAGGKDDDSVLDSPDRYHTALMQNGTNHLWYQVTGGHWFRVVACRVLYNFAKEIFW